MPNVSVKYSNGKTRPLQLVSHDEKSGNNYTEKHFVSPSGVKTDYYYEETQSEKLAEDNFHMNAHEPYHPLRGIYFPINFPESMVIMTEDIDNRIKSYLKDK